MRGKDIITSIVLVLIGSFILGLLCPYIVPYLVEKVQLKNIPLSDLKISIPSISFPSISFPSVHTPSKETKIAELFKKGQSLHDAGKYQEAIDTYKKILKIDSSNEQAMLQIAHTYRYWEKYDESEKWFLKVSNLRPNDAHIYNELGKLYRNAGRFDDAEAMFLKSTTADPTLSETYSYGLGYLYLEEAKFDDAGKAFKKALELEQNAFNYSGMADYYRKIHEFKLSEEMYKKSFELDPKTESYYGLGLLYEDEERYAEAEATLLGYIKNIREKSEVYATLARVYATEGKLDDAVKSIRRALELNPDDEYSLDIQKNINDLLSKK